MRCRPFVISLLTALFVAAPLADATISEPRPITVQSSSLTQAGRLLVWRLELTQPFSPAALAKAGRSLCLLLVRAKSLRVAGQACVVGPLPAHRAPRLVYQRIAMAGPAAARPIAATVGRPDSRGLTAAFVPSNVGMAYRSLRWQVKSTLRRPACVSGQPDPVGCVTRYPATPALAKLHTPQLVSCVPSGAPFVNSAPVNRPPSSRRMIALTFDDGPSPDTSQFLGILERYHVPATFFEIGRQISTYGQGGAIERRMLADGDMIGDHTWSHPNVSAGGSFAALQIGETAAAIKRATHGFEPCLFRAPYGATSGDLVSEAWSMGFTTVQWNIDPRDWARPGASAIYNNVVANTHPGAIVLQHDGGGDRSQTLAALPHEIQTLRSRGYQFVTVTQLLGQSLIYR